MKSALAADFFNLAQHGVAIESSEGFMSFFDQIRQRPWNSRYFQTPSRFLQYPTMLTQEEMRMLSWLSQKIDHAGDVMDLGSFLGGSTISLAYGLTSAKKSNRLHAFDKFDIDELRKFIFLYKKGHGFFAGKDSFPLFEKLVSEYKSAIVPHKGNILKERCPSSSISILFIDLSKSWELNDFIVSEFFPKLTPGSIIVQQDFLTFQNPWLYSTMMKLESKIDRLSYTEDNSVIYGVNDVLTQDDIARCLAANTTTAEVQEAIVSAKSQFPDLRQKEIIDALLATYLASPDTKASWQFTNVSKIPVTS